MTLITIITPHLITFHTSVATLAVDTELAVLTGLVMNALVHVLKESDNFVTRVPDVTVDDSLTRHPCSVFMT